jgi:hypothetical protein
MTNHMQREAEEEKKLQYAAGTKVSCNDKTSASRRREKNFQYASGTTTTAGGGGGGGAAEEKHEQQRVRAVMTELQTVQMMRQKASGAPSVPHHAFLFFFFCLHQLPFSPVGDSRLVPYPFPTRGN